MKRKWWPQQMTEQDFELAWRLRENCNQLSEREKRICKRVLVEGFRKKEVCDRSDMRGAEYLYVDAEGRRIGDATRFLGNGRLKELCDDTYGQIFAVVPG